MKEKTKIYQYSHNKLTFKRKAIYVPRYICIYVLIINQIKKYAPPIRAFVAVVFPALSKPRIARVISLKNKVYFILY